MSEESTDHASILTMPLDEVKHIAIELGYHVSAVEGGYKVQMQDEIGGPDEGTDYDLSFVAESEEKAYEAIREQLWQRADIAAWLAARKRTRMN